MDHGQFLFYDGLRAFHRVLAQLWSPTTPYVGPCCTIFGKRYKRYCRQYHQRVQRSRCPIPDGLGLCLSDLLHLYPQDEYGLRDNLPARLDGIVAAQRRVLESQHGRFQPSEQVAKSESTIFTCFVRL